MPLFNGQLTAIDAEKVKEYAAQRGQENLSAALIEECCDTVVRLAEPKGVFQQGYYEASSQHVLCNMPFKVKSEQVLNFLEESPIVLIAAITLGSKIEEEIDQKFLSRDVAGGIALDSAAAVAIGQILDQMTGYINELVRGKGYKVFWRLSPGTGDWPASQQLDLANAAGGGQIGLSVTPGGMLVPRKTVTALFSLQQTSDDCSGSCAGCSLSGQCGICE